MEPALSRTQIAVYAALGLVLVLLGLKALGAVGGSGAGPAEGGPGGGDGGVRIAGEPVGAGGEGAAAGDLVVHVAGAVRKPGVHRLPAGARVGQAIQRAGGANPGAEPDAINLAARLADGQQVVVPSRRAVASDVAGEDGPISLGSAEAEDLERIEGIGPVTAQAIIDFRDEQGGIGSVEDLDQVSGIGPATIESLSDRLQP